MKTQIINFYGGSIDVVATCAALAYAKLKQFGVKCELVNECMDDNKADVSDQIIHLGQHIDRESSFFGTTSVIVTCTPVLMNAYFAQVFGPETLAKGIESAILAFYKQAEQCGQEYINVILENPGDDVSIVENIKQMLQKFGMSYIMSSTEEYAMSDLLVRLKLIQGRK